MKFQNNDCQLYLTPELKSKKINPTSRKLSSHELLPFLWSVMSINMSYLHCYPRSHSFPNPKQLISTPPWRLPSNQLLLHSSWFFLSSLLVHHLSLFLYYMYGFMLMAMRNNVYSGFLWQVVKRQKLIAIFWDPARQMRSGSHARQIRSVSRPVL